MSAQVDILEGVLSPDETVTLTLTANLDDALPHKDELHVVVTDGENLSVSSLFVRPLFALIVIFVVVILDCVFAPRLHVRTTSLTAVVLSLFSPCLLVVLLHSFTLQR